MMMPRASVSQLISAVALAALVVSPLCAADPAPGAKEKGAPGERIRQTFDKKITIEITEQPLFLALNQLREQTKINFILDRLTIQQMGMDPEQMPVTLKLKDVTVAEAVKQVIKPFNLNYAIIGDAVFVSTDAMTMHRQLKQRITVDIDKMELAAALESLRKETGMKNIKLDEKVGKAAKTLVTLQMDDVPLDTAVRLLAEMAGLKATQDANVFLVGLRTNAGTPPVPGTGGLPTVPRE